MPCSSAEPGIGCTLGAHEARSKSASTGRKQKAIDDRRLTVVVYTLPVPRDLQNDHIRESRFTSGNVRISSHPLLVAQEEESKTHLNGIKLYSGDQDRVVLVVLSLGIPTEDRTKVVIRDELLVLSWFQEKVTER